MTQRTFVGFGFGPIQTGLMLHEALSSGSFDRAVVAEVDQALVEAVRGAGNEVTINIAGRSGIRRQVVSHCFLFNPRVPADRARIVEAIRGSSELATAVPSVDLYSAGGSASIAGMLAEGAADGRQRIVYTAENNNYAAEILLREIRKQAPGLDLPGLQILNTVVGKMSGVISSDADRERLGIAPLVPGLPRCVLVEEFNRIYISRITLPGFVRGIRVFEEKEDLLPFEEAKLYGHNAVHALLGFLARLHGLEVMSAIRGDPELLVLGRKAFLEESGASLVRRHCRTGDPLFTERGFAAYAEDLLERMTSPFLHDRVDRVIRDPVRKLGWNDRFFGTMRMALDQRIEPRTMALGAAAATEHAMQAEGAPGRSAREYLTVLWGAEVGAEHAERCIALVEDGLGRLGSWRR